MDRTLIAEIGARAGERVRLEGWLVALRRMGGVSFLLLRDRTGTAQAVLDDPAPLEGLLPETVLAVEGVVVREPRARGGIELRDVRIAVIAAVREQLPFELNKGPLGASLDTYLDHAAVGLRHPAKRATARLGAAALGAYGDWMRAHGYTEISTPKLVGAATEGGANLFRVDYFDRTAYLAQSPQLYKQIMVGALERVWEVGHAYRAEPHDTARHLNEFISLDMEMGFIRDHTEVMRALTGVLGRIVVVLGEERAEDLEAAGARLPVIGDVPAIDFAEAQELVARREGLPEDPEDLSPAQERAVCRWAEEEHGSELVFVTGYPTAHRPFYTMPDPARPERSRSFDLLFRGVELVTGGQRIHLYEELRAAISVRGLRAEDFGGYLEAFRYGMPPEGGFAMSLERLLARLVGAENVREVALFPRDARRLAP